MLYRSFSLNGAWEMEYAEEAYLSSENPFRDMTEAEDLAGTEPENMSRSIVENAVPGYWEDMTDAFAKTPFYHKLRINPEYGIQRYPIAATPPDMALPNIKGNFFYRRRFRCEGVPQAASVIHFEGVQNAVSVWLNNIYLGRHSGYSAPFDIAIPDGTLRDGDNTIVLSVSNHRLEGYAGEPVSGLTSRAANEYTGGITGDVELRTYTGALRDVVLFVSEDCETVSAAITSETETLCDWKVYDGTTLLKSGQAVSGFTFDTKALERWSPENPKLYTLEVSCGESSLRRVFGVRRLTVDDTHLRLNGIPYFLRGVCEHGYFPETIHPAHDRVFYRNVIKTLKSLGFNFIRFHTYIPEEEYLQAADELGMLMQVESPNNTTLEEWKEIVDFCRRHTSVVLYCCGNELLMDDPFIAHLHQCADVVHARTDSLFAPMSAMRGLEYFWSEPDQEPETRLLPFKHHPRRLQTVGSFSDVYCSYPNGVHSYISTNGDPAEVDENSKVYNKPRLSHEICIDGTYTDLSLKDRYKGLRVGNTEMFTSLERHLAEKGVLSKAPLYFKNSSEWQRRIRKHCFELVRRSEHIAGYDFLGPIDTHWHTFGYDVGMMNEFYELKPGETVRNVLMYNSETVLLTDLDKHTNYTAGETLSFSVFTSHYGAGKLRSPRLTLRLTANGKLIKRETVTPDEIMNGTVSKIHEFSAVLPVVEKPCAMKLYTVLDSDEVFAENEWELYLFPEAKKSESENLVVSAGMPCEELLELLREGKDVLLLGAEPFVSLPTSFRIALAGRTSGNLATVIADHPALEALPHEGFCGWQFAQMLEGGHAVCFESDAVPFHPIIEVVSTHKYVIRQAALFEFRALGGRLLVCSLNLSDNDPAAQWLKGQLIAYAQSDAFDPQDYIDEQQLLALIKTNVKKAAANTNLAFNPNDKTATRKAAKKSI